MSKLAWVALPLLLAAVWLALSLLRGGRPSRQALNVATSLLLLVYLFTTAGLGIFWVANQQLPVFDWHYLFGYATVLLVTVHLVFNLPAVWRFFTRPAPGRSVVPPATVRPGGRRFALAGFALAVVAVPAFLLGLRHGRSELRIVGAPSPAGDAEVREAAALSLALVEQFHAFSGHSRGGVLLRAPGAEWSAAAADFKQYPGAAKTQLPAPGPQGLAALAGVLWHTCGITEDRGGLRLRASPSSGALFSTELYVATNAIEGLPGGLWHYDALDHRLERLPGAGADLLRAAGQPGQAVAVVVATAVFQRTGRKYRDRTYRYVLADLGHALENLRVAAHASGFEPRFVAGFDEAGLAALLGLDESEEGVLAVVALSGEADRVGWQPLPAQRWEAPMQALRQQTPRDLTTAIHLGTSLRTPPGPAAPPAAEGQALAGERVLPSEHPAAVHPLAVIARRRSVRRFSAQPLPLSALAAVLARMAAPGTLSEAVRIHVISLSVEDLPAGAWRYHPGRHSLAPYQTGNLRAATQAAGLDQQVIGDAAAVFVITIVRAAFAADPHGPGRGYRHAFLEAGLVGERVYLEAVARGLGACGVGAFYDEEAAALVGIDPAREWVVHLAALGVPSA